MAKLDPKDLLAAGGHFGHKTSRWHPKMAPYIYGTRDKTHIIDLIKTVDMIDEATAFIEKTVASGKHVMLVGTKKQAQAVVRDAAQGTSMPYVVERWLGGMLTNYETMQGRIKYLKKLEKQLENGELDARYNKLEVQRFEEEIAKLNLNFGGIKDMAGMPGALFITDVVEDQNAVKEAIRLGIPVVGVCDTNANPDGIDYIIPANDDAIKALKLITDQIVKAIEAGKAKQKQAPAEEKTEKGGK